MASSSSRLSYQRLRKVPEGIEEDEVGGARAGEEVVVVESSRRRRSWPRLEGRRRWRRPRVRVAGLQWLLRRKAKLVSNALAKILKRLKEGRPYVGELFAGNYMFMQVSPSPTMGYMGSKYSLPGHPKNAFNPSPSSSDHVARGVWT